MADCIKYGIQIPNRVFVGGVAFDTKEEELKEFFSQYGKVKDCKIVTDKDGNSRRFGFVTFEAKQDAIQVQKLGTVFFKQKRLNLGPAIRQKGVVFNNGQEPAVEPVVSSGVYMHPSGYCYTVAPNGMWYFHPNGQEQQNGQVAQRRLSQTSSTPPSTHSTPPLPMNMVPLDPVQPTYAAPTQYMPGSGGMALVQSSPSLADVPMGFMPPDGVAQYYPLYNHNPSPGNHFAITTPVAQAPPLAQAPPPPQPPQPGAVVNQEPPRLRHVNCYIPIANPRPEYYHMVPSPIEAPLLERGPVVPFNGVPRRHPQAVMPINCISARVPVSEKRFFDARFTPNGMVPPNGLVTSQGGGQVVGYGEK